MTRKNIFALGNVQYGCRSNSRKDLGEGRMNELAFDSVETCI